MREAPRRWASPLRCLERVPRPLIGVQVCPPAPLLRRPSQLLPAIPGTCSVKGCHPWRRVCRAAQGAHTAAKERAAPRTALAMVAALAVDARGGGRLPDGLAYDPCEQLALPHWGGGLSLERLKTGGGLQRAPRAPCANGKLSALGLANAWAGAEREPGAAEPAGAPVTAAEAANRERAAAAEPAGVPVFVMLPLDTVSAPAAQFLQWVAHGH